MITGGWFVDPSLIDSSMIKTTKIASADVPKRLIMKFPIQKDIKSTNKVGVIGLTTIY